MNEYNRVTVLLTVTSGGKKLKPIIIFKGAPASGIYKEVS
jgi:hypothetical protein